MRNSETNSQKVNIKLIEFKVEDKIDYYIVETDILKYLSIKKEILRVHLQNIKNGNGSTHVIKYKNKYYVSQFGFEYLAQNLLSGKQKNNIVINLIIGKFRNKRNKGKNVNQSGLKPNTNINKNMITRVVNKEIYISSMSISRELKISHADLVKKIYRESYFNKNGIQADTKNKHGRATSYIINKMVYDKIINIENNKIEETYNKI